MSKKLSWALCCLLFFAACNQNPPVDNTPVQHVDLNRYLGTWYEIARFQHSFEKDLVAVTAHYRLKNDQSLFVVNSGRKDSLTGPLEVAQAKAKVPDPANPGHLRVSFFAFAYADYNIMELDTVDYQYALVGSGSPKYLWILGRKPQMDESTYQMLVEKARKRGYDVDQLYKVPQPTF